MKKEPNEGDTHHLRGSNGGKRRYIKWNHEENMVNKKN